jgi:hypothetical protein
MNERIRELADEAGSTHKQNLGVYQFYTDELEKFAELIVQEFIGILKTEIELVEGYKSTACNDFDVAWHEGKILHFTKLVEKSKKHFGVK